MWSDRYHYFNIYKDESLSEYTHTQELRDYLSTIPELEQKGDCEFKNSKTLPFAQLLLLKAKSLQSWSNHDHDPLKTNLITIVCAKGEHIDLNRLKKVFIKIASFLNWKLVEEETDDGIHDLIIWPTE